MDAHPFLDLFHSPYGVLTDERLRVLKRPFKSWQGGRVPGVTQRHSHVAQIADAFAA